MSAIRAELQRGIEDLVTREGYELVHLELKFGSGRHFLRIFIDRPGGVTLDDCQKISALVSTLLDVEDPIPHQFVLEVSSPGLDRRLHKEADYVRFIGRRVRLTLRQPIGHRRNYRGRILAAGDGIVRVSAPPDGDWSFPIDAIEKANLEIEL